MIKLRRAVLKLTLLGAGTEARGGQGGGKAADEASRGERGEGSWDGGVGRGGEWTQAQRVLVRRRAMTQPYLDLWDEEAEAQLLARYDVFASRGAMHTDLASRLRPPPQHTPLTGAAQPHAPVTVVGDRTQALLDALSLRRDPRVRLGVAELIGPLQLPHLAGCQQHRNDKRSQYFALTCRRCPNKDRVLH